MWRLKLSYLYWQRHPWWLLGAMLSVAVTVGLAFAVSHLWLATREAYSSLVLKPLGEADSQIVATDDEGMFAAWQTALQTMPELDVMTPVLNRQTVAIYKDTKVSVQVRGIDPTTDALIHPFRLLEGRTIAEEDKTSAVLSSTLAKQLGMTLGETLELVTPQGFRNYKVVGIAEEASSIILAPLREVQTLFTSGDYVDGFDVRFTPTLTKTISSQKLQERLKGVATVMTPSERVEPVHYVLVVVRVLLCAVLAFSIVMMGCLLFSFLEATQQGRSDEAKVLYSLGVSRETVTRWLVLELSTIFTLASFLGVGTAVILLQRQEAALSYLSFLVAGILAFLVVMAVVLFFHFPLRATMPGGGRGWLHHLPIRVWFSWQLFTQLGRRYWLAVTIFTVSLTGFTSLGLILQVQRESLGSLLSAMTSQPILTERTLQIQEESPLEGTLSNTLRWNMAMMPGVVFVSSHLTRVMMEEKFEENMYVLDLASFPYQSYFQTLDGVVSEDLPKVLKEDRNLAISESLATSYGLTIGTWLQLSTPTGNHRYKIVAVIKDMGGVSRAMFIDRQGYLKDWGRSSDNLFLLSFEEALRPQQVAGLLQEQLNGRYKGLPWRAASFKSELEQLVGEIVAWCRWLMLVFVVIAAISLSHAFSSPAFRDLLSTFYLLGGQRRWLGRVTRNTILLTMILITSMSLALGTSLSYFFVSGLEGSGSYWLWRVSGPSYVSSLLIVLALVLVLVLVLRRHLTLFYQRS
jgi:ABC-type lipoprotein release transport system permease subunit